MVLLRLKVHTGLVLFPVLDKRAVKNVEQELGKNSHLFLKKIKNKKNHKKMIKETIGVAPPPTNSNGVKLPVNLKYL